MWCFGYGQPPREHQSVQARLSIMQCRSTALGTGLVVHVDERGCWPKNTRRSWLTGAGCREQKPCRAQPRRRNGTGDQHPA
jgi:hypothetical protein